MPSEKMIRQVAEAADTFTAMGACRKIEVTVGAVVSIV